MLYLKTKKLIHLKIKIMKKLIMLSVVGVFTLSSFGVNNTESKSMALKMRLYNYYCNGIYSGQLWAADGEQALYYANIHCND